MGSQKIKFEENKCLIRFLSENTKYDNTNV